MQMPGPHCGSPGFQSWPGCPLPGVTPRLSHPKSYHIFSCSINKADKKANKNIFFKSQPKMWDKSRTYDLN